MDDAQVLEGQLRPPASLQVEATAPLVATRLPVSTVDPVLLLPAVDTLPGLCHINSLPVNK